MDVRAVGEARVGVAEQAADEALVGAPAITAEAKPWRKEWKVGLSSFECQTMSAVLTASSKARLMLRWL
jgi:hypothetical protein